MLKQNTWEALFYVLYCQVQDTIEMSEAWMDMELFIADYAMRNEHLIWADCESDD